MSKQYLNVLKECVIETGKNSLRHLEGHVEAGSKASHKELVTFVDRQNEQLIVQRIKEDFPHHKFMGEESYTGEVFDPNDFIWIVDPIDGTTNYLHQKQTFAISIAFCTRMDKGFAAYVACGRFNAYFSSLQKPWDFAAGKLLVEEAGGKITRLNGDPIDTYQSGSSILAASKELHLEILNISKRILYT